VFESTRLGNARKPAQPAPIPGYQEFFARRFELSLRLLDRHSHLAARRSSSALLVALIDLLAAAISFGLYAFAVNSGIGLPVQVLLLLLMLFVWGCSLAAIFFALKAAHWRRSGENEVSEAGIFFASGDELPGASGVLQDPLRFSQQFHQISQNELLTGAVNALRLYSLRRIHQEHSLHRAIFWTIVALPGMGLAALIALLAML
jgi:hypothetical protein